jgi:GH15 family glucan-1,4-alpha-glucosidase
VRPRARPNASDEPVEASGDDQPYPPIRELAVIGDGRTLAVVALDGTIAWLPVPYVDSPSVFASLLDARRGGRCSLAPDEPFEARRRYVPKTNVLETTFITADGVVRVIDALTLPIGGGLVPFRELTRRIEGVSGAVHLRWSVEPRFGYGADVGTVGLRSGVPVATSGEQAMAVCSWGAGSPRLAPDRISSTFEIAQGSTGLIALAMASQEPLVLPSRPEVERRLDDTIGWWQRWAAGLDTAGVWRDQVLRSALALKLLVQAKSGSIAAAPTTSLPEEIGGERNWDYRFSWLRDSAFVMSAMLDLGCTDEAEAFFWWLMHASQITHPRMQVLYRMDGGADAPERTLQLDGYQGSRPVRVGNEAVEQAQLDIYGDVMQMAWLYADAGHAIDREFRDRLAAVADLVCRIWSEPDAGIWEMRDQERHFTQSKMMCWVALDRAVRFAVEGQIPSGTVERWRSQADAIRSFVEERCWSAGKGSYTQAADTEDLDASVLLGAIFGYGDPAGPRFSTTIDAVRLELGRGPFLYRYRNDDDIRGDEGTFLCCSFWLAEVLGLAGRREEAVDLLNELIGLQNDVGLYAEEIDPSTSAFLGNFPQALTHLALMSAAASLTGAP